VLELEACRCDLEGWHGLVPNAPRRWRQESHAFQCWVAGLSHHEDAAQDPSFAPGRVLALVAEPDNPVDERAVAVWNEARTPQIGYVSASVAHEVPPVSAERFAVALGELIEDGRRRRLEVLISREPCAIRVTHEPDDPCRHRSAGRERQARRHLEADRAGREPHEDPFEQMVREWRGSSHERE